MKKKNVNLKDEVRKAVGNTLTAVGNTVAFIGVGKILPVRYKGHHYHGNNYHVNVK